MKTALTVILSLIFLVAAGCAASPQTLPHQGAWGIYRLDLETQSVVLVRDFGGMEISSLHLDAAGNKFAFSGIPMDVMDADSELYTLDIRTLELEQLTDNDAEDYYPVWSPDGSRIAFLSMRDGTMDIFVMNTSGDDVGKLYDSGGHDADIDWVGDSIAFTSGSAIWIMDENGSGPQQVTFPPHAGEWGSANLPRGDYDPRISPDGGRIVFERLEDAEAPNGGYNFFLIAPDGSGETRLTDTGYAQGIANWSRSGDRLVWIVAAIDGSGKYDIYMMNADGSGRQNITPDYFPPDFLCHDPLFSPDGAGIYFIGQYWE